MKFENDFYSVEQRLDNSIENARKMLEVSIKVASDKLELSITNAKVQLEETIKKSRHVHDTSIKIAKQSLEDCINLGKLTLNKSRLSNERGVRKTLNDMPETMIKLEEVYEECFEETDHQTLNNDFQMSTDSKTYQDEIHDEFSEEISNSVDRQPLNNCSKMNTESNLYHHQEQSSEGLQITSKETVSSEVTIAERPLSSRMPSTKESPFQSMVEAENRYGKLLVSNKRKPDVSSTEVKIENESETCSKVIKIENDDDEESDEEEMESPNQSCIENADHHSNENDDDCNKHRV